MNQVVMIDGDENTRAMLEDHLKGSGHSVVSFRHPEEAISQILSNGVSPWVILTDLQIPGITGEEITKKIKAQFPHVPIIVMTAFASIEAATDAMKSGAFDYVTKPFKLTDVSFAVNRALQLARLAAENQGLRSELKNSFSKGQLIGKCEAMRELFDLIERVAPAQSNVLITGESGTGKEVVARTIHSLSTRSQMPFIAVNCTAIPAPLLESELFGTSEGNPSLPDKMSLLQAAHGGTLFLDEIADLDFSLQSKLLRILQTKKMRPPHGTQEIDLDVRVIATTKKDLKQAIREGLFREDLFYRLNVIPVSIPALRYRKEDIPLLAQAFLERFSATNKSPARRFSPEALQLLMSRSWPGNVRELESYVERLTVLITKPLIEVSDLPPPESLQMDDFYGNMIRDLPSLEDLEKRYIHFVLTKFGGKKERVSQVLGINRRTLYRKEREYGFVAIDANDGDTE